MNTVLNTENLTVKTATGEILKCNDMEFYRGELVAIVGPLSSGKSSLLGILAGHYPVECGKLQILNTGFSECTYQQIQRVRARTGFVFEIGALLSNLNLYDNIALPLRYHFKKLKKSAVDRQITKQMKLFHIEEYAGLRPTDLPLEVKKRALFCRALIMRPKILFLDEPFVGLGLYGRKLVKNMIEDVLKRKTATIITSISDIDLIYPFASRFVIMSHKEIKSVVSGRDELDKLRNSDSFVSNLFQEV